MLSVCVSLMRSILFCRIRMCFSFIISMAARCSEICGFVVLFGRAVCRGKANLHTGENKGTFMSEIQSELCSLSLLQIQKRGPEGPVGWCPKRPGPYTSSDSPLPSKGSVTKAVPTASVQHAKDFRKGIFSNRALSMLLSFGMEPSVYVMLSMAHVHTTKCLHFSAFHYRKLPYSVCVPEWK